MPWLCLAFPGSQRLPSMQSAGSTTALSPSRLRSPSAASLSIDRYSTSQTGTAPQLSALVPVGSPGSLAPGLLVQSLASPQTPQTAPAQLWSDNPAFSVGGATTSSSLVRSVDPLPVRVSLPGTSGSTSGAGVRLETVLDASSLDASTDPLLSSFEGTPHCSATQTFLSDGSDDACSGSQMLAMPEMIAGKLSGQEAAREADQGAGPSEPRPVLTPEPPAYLPTLPIIPQDGPLPDADLQNLGAGISFSSQPAPTPFSVADSALMTLAARRSAAQHALPPTLSTIAEITPASSVVDSESPQTMRSRQLRHSIHSPGETPERREGGHGSHSMVEMLRPIVSETSQALKKGIMEPASHVSKVGTDSAWLGNHR